MNGSKHSERRAGQPLITPQAAFWIFFIGAFAALLMGHWLIGLVLDAFGG